MAQNSVSIGFPQKLDILFKKSRYKVLYGGRGGAKSWGVARALLVLGAQSKLRILCARELQKSIADSVHKLLSDQIIELGLNGFYTIQNTALLGKNGTQFYFTGLKHNAAQLKSYEGVDIVWVEEGHAVTKHSWNILTPTIRKTDSEIWITFNPEFEDDETYERFVLNPPGNCLIQKVNWRDNPWFPSVLDEERLSLKTRNHDDYLHVWEGQCRRWLEGAIYAKELRAAYGEEGTERRIGTVPHDPDYPVHTAWDIGRTDDTAIWWFQVIGGEIRLLECYSQNFRSISHFGSEILGKECTIDLVETPNPNQTPGNPRTTCKVKAQIGNDIAALSHRRHYRYGYHWLPHDARAKTLSANGKATIQQLGSVLGISKMRITPELSREDRIQAARMMFGRCWFDKDGCDDGLKALRQYQRELQTDEKSFKKNPRHDWPSHASDAFGYGMIACRYESTVIQEAESHTVEVNGKSSLSIEDMWHLRDKQSTRPDRI